MFLSFLPQTSENFATDFPLSTTGLNDDPISSLFRLQVLNKIPIVPVD